VATWTWGTIKPLGTLIQHLLEASIANKPLKENLIINFLTTF
jgi:hypothetical protein